VSLRGFSFYSVEYLSFVNPVFPSFCRVDQMTDISAANEFILFFIAELMAVDVVNRSSTLSYRYFGHGNDFRTSYARPRLGAVDLAW
jgi:hypothetical protein